MAIFLNSYRQAAAFRPERFNPVVVTENERVKVIEACFEPGQFIPVHQPGVDLTLAVLEGTGSLVADGREEPIAPRTVASMTADKEIAWAATRNAWVLDPKIMSRWVLLSNGWFL